MGRLAVAIPVGPPAPSDRNRGWAGTGFLHPEQLFGKLLLPVVSLSVAIIIVGISVAGNIAFKFLGARVGFEVVLVSPDIAASVLPPLGATALLMTAVCLVLYLRRPTLETEIPAEEDPSALKAPFLFGALCWSSTP